MLFDTHAHIDMLSDPELAIKEARNSGVGEIIIPSANEESFECILKLCDKFENIYSALGVHPCDCEKFNNKTLEKIAKYAQHKKVVAIGEIGLDYYYTKENKEIQKKVFISQIDIAKALDLPIIVHDRDAHFDTFEILKESKIEKVLLHCFSGSVEFMKQCCQMGYKIAMGGVVTFKNARVAKEVIKEIELNNLMLETDCPYLTPHPFRGVENSPKYIGFTAKEIANLKNISYDDIVNITAKNAREFFKINID